MKPYWYELPQEKIAERPIRPYDSAKLLVSVGEQIVDSVFTELPQFLSEKDLLLFNDTKVIAARFYGTKPDTGAALEMLLEKKLSSTQMRVLAKPLKKIRAGDTISIAESFEALVVERGEKSAILEVRDVDALLDRAGTVPIPPYIRKGISDKQDRVDYQTHFAKHSGSIAAPTASLHFTPELMRALPCQKRFLTLHVGSASFQPLFNESEQLLEHPGSESYAYDSTLLAAIEKTRSDGGNVVAVGTTAVRAIETMARAKKCVDGTYYETDLFIEPGFTFLAVDKLVTNFHQPGTTHLLLVEAFTGREKLDQIYRHGLKERYRFLSYGDGMLL